jgi:cytochrome c-type biogenesis protein
MTDPIAAAIAAAAAQSAWAPALAFAAGVATSLGPCVAPRFVAVAALASAGRARWKSIAAFAGGLCVSYVALGVASGLLSRVAALSVHLYAALALVLLAAGSYTLLREPTLHPCDGTKAANGSLGGAFLLGTSSALVTSPCCTPVIVILGSLAAARSSAPYGAALIAAYALGHALPLAGAGFGWNAIGVRLNAESWSGALQTVTGALMLALAAYYGVLA